MSSSDSRYENPRSIGKLFEALALVTILLAAALVLGAHNGADPDLWGHVQFGRDSLAAGLSATTTYSFTAEGFRWINHENLAEILFALGADSIGVQGLLIAKMLMSVVMVAMMLVMAQRKQIGMVAAGGAALLAVLVIGFSWGLRPQLFSYFYFALMITLLSWCFDGWEGRWHLPWLKLHRPTEDQFVQVGLSYSPRKLRWLWLAVPLFVVWTNTHGGFVAGYVLFSAYLVVRSIEALAVRGAEGWGLVRRFALMIAAAGFATFLNPYGPGLHAWLIESLGQPRPEITEWWPPEMNNLGDMRIVAIWTMLVVFVFSLVFSGKRRDLAQMTLLGLTFWQSMEHQRHLPFFAILFGFWMPAHIHGMLKRAGFSKDEKVFGEDLSVGRRWAFGGLMTCLILGLSAALSFQVREAPVARELYPVSAVEFMKERNLNGKMVVTYNWAQYIIGAMGAKSHDDQGIHVSFDGRFRTCYPQEIVDMHFDFLLGDGDSNTRHRGENSGPFDPTRVLKHKQPELLLLSRLQEHGTDVMETQHDEWVLLYQDELSQVWGVRWKYDRPLSPDYLSPEQRIVGNEEQEGHTPWPAVPPTNPEQPQIAAR